MPKQGQAHVYNPIKHKSPPKQIGGLFEKGLNSNLSATATKHDPRKSKQTGECRVGGGLGDDSQ